MNIRRVREIDVMCGSIDLEDRIFPDENRDIGIISRLLPVVPEVECIEVIAWLHVVVRVPHRASRKINCVIKRSCCLIVGC